MACLLGWSLLALAWIDVRAMILPDILTLPLLLMGLLVTEVRNPAALTDHALAAALGYSGLCLLAWSYRRFRGQDGLGPGDAKLLGAMGAWLGPGLLPAIVFLAACSGLLFAGVLMLAGKRVTPATALPFGPCLALAGWILWLYGDTLSDWLD